VNRNLRSILLYVFFIVLGLFFLANTLQPAGQLTLLVALSSWKLSRWSHRFCRGDAVVS